MRAGALVLAAATLVALATPATGAADPGDHRPRQRGAQTSDGEPGRIAAYLPPGLRTPPVITRDETWPVAPGVTFRSWDQTDERGPIRASLLTLDLATTPGLSIDYAGGRRVSQVDTVGHMVEHDHAIAGVNGDFYDIGDTGAPLGLGADRQRGLLNARKSGWNRAFVVKNGVPAIRNDKMTAKVVQEPWLKISHYNSPEIFDGQIGIYDYRWGSLQGYRVVDGQQDRVREVVIRDNVVVANRTTLDEGRTVTGTVLIGRGDGADALGSLRKGERARVSWHLRGRPEVAISGNKVLLLHGVRRVVDDRELHPRTAIGIDHATGQVLMLVVDGRQSFSRGYTMVELATLMAGLGADDALNLDGGGSTTMIAPDPTGVIGVRNSPSDGFERLVANGLEVDYTPPSTPRRP